jgi:hypothetical protein
MPTAKPVPGKMLLSPTDHTLILKSQSGLIKQGQALVCH